MADAYRIGGHGPLVAELLAAPSLMRAETLRRSTLFGHGLWSYSWHGSHQSPTLQGPTEREKAGVSVLATSQGSKYMENIPWGRKYVVLPTLSYLDPQGL